jgi:hypothetical protein
VNIDAVAIRRADLGFVITHTVLRASAV